MRDKATSVSPLAPRASFATPPPASARPVSRLAQSALARHRGSASHAHSLFPTERVFLSALRARLRLQSAPASRVTASAPGTAQGRSQRSAQPAKMFGAEIARAASHRAQHLRCSLLLTILAYAPSTKLSSPRQTDRVSRAMHSVLEAVAEARPRNV